MRVLDLFSGIGGFSLGLEMAGMETVAFCEAAASQRKDLKRNWPGVPIFDDVRTLRGDEIGTVDVICGGFPCTDISRAGKMQGLAGERSGLWSEMRRLIEELRPNYVVIENVAMLRSNGLASVMQDLAALNYDAEGHCIPGYAVGSPQERDRIYIVAYASSLGHRGAGWVGRWISGSQEARQAGWCGDAEEDVQLWIEPKMDRVADGLPAEVSGCRKLGNAVIPQIPQVIGMALMAFEKERMGDSRCADDEAPAVGQP